MSRTVAIVQARMGSTRFPGKMLQRAGGRALLGWVLERVKRAEALDGVVLATTDKAADDALEALAAGLGCGVFRGSEADVLGRFCGAARASAADAVVRVCADNPLIAPEAVDTVVGAFQAEEPDYAYNHLVRAGSVWPDGLGAEVLAARLLFDLDAGPRTAAQREHVTQAIWDDAERYDILAVPCPEAWRDPDARVKLDVDTPADLERLRPMLDRLDPDSTVDAVLSAWRALDDAA